MRPVLIDRGPYTEAAYRDYQITRLAARILDLKSAGYHIKTDMREHPLTGTRYARYTFMLETNGKTKEVMA